MAENTVEKATYALTSEQLVSGLAPGAAREDLRKRGLNVYTISELWGVAGRTKDEKILTGMIERPLFGLSLQERVDLFRKCSPVFGIILSRMNRISGLEWSIERESKDEDREESRLKMLNSIHSEYDDPDDILHRIVRIRAVREIRSVLPDCRPDLMNFQRALLRWRNKIRERSDDMSRQMQDWLSEPNSVDTYDDFIKKSVQDAMVHGNFSWYKEREADGKKIDNLYVLPGGTVIPMKQKYVGGADMYIQMIDGMEPKLYFKEEITFSPYVPSSAQSYGMVPLEALVNKLAEVLLFDHMSASRADGTDVPKKLVVFGENAPFGDLTAAGMNDDMRVPIDKDEQSRIETIVNEPRKQAIRILSGMSGSTPVVVDLSRADTYQYQSDRQKQIREEVALVYNMSNVEINMTGSDGTSGRSTSESQERIEREKGVYPIVKQLETKFNKEVLCQRWSSQYKLKYKTGLSEQEELDLDMQKIQSKTYSINEIRIARGEEPFNDPQFDVPDGASQSPPDGSSSSPFNVNMGA